VVGCTALVFLFSLACLSVSECNATLAQLLRIDNVFAYYYFFAGCSDMQSDWRRKVEECTQVRKRVVAWEFRAEKYTMRDEVAVAARRGAARAHLVLFQKAEEERKRLHCSESAVTWLCNGRCTQYVLIFWISCKSNFCTLITKTQNKTFNFHTGIS
jgi:hypothetical protein